MKTKFLSVFVSCILLFVSCSDDDDSITKENEIPVKFSSVITASSLKVGGMGGDEWEVGDAIGVFMRDNASSKTIVKNNILHKATTAGTSTFFTSEEPIYYPVNAPKAVDFVAYHPYAVLTNKYVYSVNVASQTDQSAIDLMATSNDNNGRGFNKAAGSVVNLDFKHQLAKVVMNVTAGEGVGGLQGLTVNIKGMHTTADFDISNTTFSNEDGAATSDITPYNDGSNSYEAILLPVATLGTSHVVEFTLGGDIYAWTMTANDGGIIELEAGKKYTFNVKLQKINVQVTGSITAWDNGGTANGTAKY